MRPNRILRAANWGFGFIFLVGAVLQWNDPDPWRWLITYLAAAVVCLMSNFRQDCWKWALILPIVCIVWAASMIPDVWPGFRFGDLLASMKAENPSIELRREFLGLSIISGWMVVLVIDQWRTGKKSGRKSGRDQ